MADTEKTPRAKTRAKKTQANSQFKRATEVAVVNPQMQQAKQWLLRDAKKKPFYVDGAPRHGKLDRPEDIARLATYDEALAYQRKHPHLGLGFAVIEPLDGSGSGGDTGFQFIDLDKCYDAGGVLKPEFVPAYEAARAAGAYVERSMGGKGLHLIGYGPRWTNQKKPPVERYSRQRYCALGFAIQTGTGPLPDLTPVLALLPASETPSRTRPNDAGAPISGPATSQTFAVGYRNDALFEQGCQFRRLGLAEDQVHALLWQWNQKHCTPPLEDDELAVIVGSACRQQPPELPLEIAMERLGHGLKASGISSPVIAKPEPKVEEPAFEIIDGDSLRAVAYPEQVFATEGEIRLATGTYLLAGKPKHGKSWLALGLTMATVTGEEYLGTRIAQRGQAVYISCDDSSRERAQRRVDAFKPSGSIAGYWLVTKWNVKAKSSLDVLDAMADAHPQLRLVVIDTLSAFRERQRSDTPYQQEYDELKAINDWSHRRGVVVLVVHHLRKGEVDPRNPFESISGTLGLQGAVDGLMVLSRADDEDETDAAGEVKKLAGFWFRSRDLDTEASLGICLHDGRWRIVGRSWDVFAAGTQRLVLTILQEASGRWMSSTEIFKEGKGLWSCKEDGVRKACQRMAKRGEIESHKGTRALSDGIGGGGFRWVPPTK